MRKIRPGNAPRLLPILCLFLLSSSGLLACDLCNVYLSIYPNDFTNSIGLVYRYRTYKAYATTSMSRDKRHTVNGLADDQKTLLEEYFETTEIQGRYFLTPELQLVGILPYSRNRNAQDAQDLNRLSGLGDASLMGVYQLYNTMGDTTGGFVHRISAGGGFKFPTGQFDSRNDDEDLIDPHLQTGSGSMDYAFLVEYLAQWQNFGLSTNATYRYNSTNRNGFKFANRINSYANVFYTKSWSSVTIMPEMGLYYEQARRDSQSDEWVANSGGKALFTSVGASVYLGPVAVYAKYQDPLWQDLYDVQIPNYERVIVGITANIR